DRGGVARGRPRLAVLVPAPPAVDARDDEEDLPARLAVEGDPLAGPEDRPDIDEEEHDVGADADRPGPDPALHAEVGRGQPDEDADELEPVNLVRPDGNRGIDELLEDVLGGLVGHRE